MVALFLGLHNFHFDLRIVKLAGDSLWETEITLLLDNNIILLLFARVLHGIVFNFVD